MTRKEQIIQAAMQEEKKVGFAQIVKDANRVNSAYGIGFLEGAKWADEHSIEVKEVDLDEEADLEYLVKEFCYEFDDRKDKWYEMTPHDKNIMTNPTWSNFAMQLAKHFFELGIKAQKGR